MPKLKVPKLSELDGWPGAVANDPSHVVLLEKSNSTTLKVLNARTQKLS